MKPGKRRRIGLLTKDAGTDESEQETRATIIEQDDEVVVTFGGDTEDELEDEYDDDGDGQHSSMDSSPLTTRVRLRYYYIFYDQTNVKVKKYYQSYSLSNVFSPIFTFFSVHSEHVTTDGTAVRLLDADQNDASQNEGNEGDNVGLSSNRSERLDNIWTKCDSALRHLLVFLVKKHRVDEVYDSKVKAQNWEKLIIEFNEMTEGMVGMPKAQIIRKWHNWKQYNKQRSKSHPFIDFGNISHEEILQKCQALMQQAQNDPALAAYLLKGGNEPQSSVSEDVKKTDINTSGGARENGEEAGVQEIGQEDIRMPGNERLKRLRDRDFLVRRTGISAASLSIKKLEHEIALESLSYEQERWKIRLENNQLFQQKVQRQSELADLKLERAKTELALKKHECLSLGLSV